MKETGFALIAAVLIIMISSCAGGGYREDPSVPLTKLKASEMFRNYMVLQREAPVPVWGTGHRGKTVQVRFMDQQKTTAVEADGTWKLLLDPLPVVSEGQDFTIEYLADPKIDLGRKIPGGRTYREVLVGDVWLCSGQSNMEYGMAGIYEKEKQAEDLDYPQIRVYMIYKHAQGVPRSETNATWFPARRNSIFTGGWHGFSAVAFTFGRKIYNETGVPVGLIQAAFGGSKIEAWIPPKELAENPELEMQYTVLKKAEDYYNEQLKKNPEASHPFNIIGDNYAKLRPATAYFGMITPVAPYALRGIIWYQGESDIGAFKLYAKWTEILIKGFRRVFNNDSLPFYQVQLAPYKKYSTGVLPKFWEAQAAAMAIPNTGMALTVDIGDEEDIHPKRKLEAGERLALQALAGTYGRTEINPDGPVYSRHKEDSDSITVYFLNSDNGLKTADNSKEVYGFSVAGEDMIFYPAKAEINGSTVILSSEKVQPPVHIRYAWDNFPTVNLVNCSGLPAMPFRTDK